MGNLTNLTNIILKHKVTIITMLIFFTLGLIAMNQMISIMAKADLLLNACELCEQAGNTCTRKFIILNITK